VAEKLAVIATHYASNPVGFIDILAITAENSTKTFPKAA